MRVPNLFWTLALAAAALQTQACLVVEGEEDAGADAGVRQDAAGSDVTADAGSHDTAPPTYVVSCSLPRPDLGALTDVTATPQSGCVMAQGDSITVQRVATSALPLVDGTTIYASGDFVLASQASAEIRMFVYPASVSDCVAGVASGPSGQFEVWGQVGGVPDGGATVISVDFSYGTTSTDCRHDLAP